MEDAAFRSSWDFTRGLTLDLVGTLDTGALEFAPGPGLGPMWKQFRHVGRVQENYVEALEGGRIRFAVTDTYRGGASSDDLAAYLRSVDDRMNRVLDSIAGDVEIDWGEERIPLDMHLDRLVAHETLHHGQWVVYLRLRGEPFPPTWSAWGL